MKQAQIQIRNPNSLKPKKRNQKLKQKILTKI